MTGAVAYNPSDSLQQKFLQALALGETGGSINSATEGYGGVDLSGAPHDAYGFPVWSGANNSHAAGTFQFQPSTWDQLAGKYGLDFQKPADQSAGAWYEAQQTYASATGGHSLEEALSSGNFGSIQSALAAVWPSVTGNQSSPQGISGALITNLKSGSAGGGDSGATSSQFDPLSPSTWLPAIENWFLRGGLILLGAMIILVALYFLFQSSAMHEARA